MFVVDGDGLNPRNLVLDGRGSPIVSSFRTKTSNNFGIEEGGRRGIGIACMKYKLGYPL